MLFAQGQLWTMILCFLYNWDYSAYHHIWTFVEKGVSITFFFFFFWLGLASNSNPHLHFWAGRIIGILHYAWPAFNILNSEKKNLKAYWNKIIKDHTYVFQFTLPGIPSNTIGSFWMIMAFPFESPTRVLLFKLGEKSLLYILSQVITNIHAKFGKNVSGHFQVMV
jgi:hypothetical protein